MFSICSCGGKAECSADTTSTFLIIINVENLMFNFFTIL